MKTSKLLAAIAATVAIAGGVQLSDTNGAVACILSKKSAITQSGGSTNGGGSLLSKIFPLRSDNAGIWTAAGTAGLLGLGALYLTLQGSDKAAASIAVDATADESKHPEAPGGEFDLPEEVEVVEVVAQEDSEKEIALV